MENETSLADIRLLLVQQKSALESGFESVNSKLHKIDSVVSINSAEISALKNKQQAADHAIAALDAKVENLSANLDIVSKRTNSNHMNISSLDNGLFRLQRIRDMTVRAEIACNILLHGVAEHEGEIIFESATNNLAARNFTKFEQLNGIASRLGEIGPYRKTLRPIIITFNAWKDKETFVTDFINTQDREELKRTKSPYFSEHNTKIQMSEIAVAKRKLSKGKSAPNPSLPNGSSSSFLLPTSGEPSSSGAGSSSSQSQRKRPADSEDVISSSPGLKKSKPLGRPRKNAKLRSS
jgi:hypothetical protein